MKFLLPTILLLFQSSLFSQPTEEWVRQFNSGIHQYDTVSDMKIDAFGNIYLCGNKTDTNLNQSLLLIKYNTVGSLIWAKTYSPNFSKGSSISKMAIDNFGNVIAIGTVHSGISVDYLIIKFNENGDTLWTRSFDGGNVESDIPNDLILGEEGSIYVTGIVYKFANSDMGTLKYSKDGTLIWSSIFRGRIDNYDGGTSLLIDSNYVFVGGYSYKDFINGYDASILKYNFSGNLLDTLFCGNTEIEGSSKIIFDFDENFVIGGQERNQGPTQDNILLTKLSKNNNKFWRSVYNNNGDNAPEYMRELLLNVDSNILLLARSRNIQTGRSKFSLLKFNNETGDTIWAQNYNSIPFSNDDPSSMSIDKSGNVFITGSSDFNSPYFRIITIKYSSSGQFQWHKEYTPSILSNTYGLKVSIDNLGNLYVTGTTSSTPFSKDIVLIKYSLITHSNISNSLIPQKFDLEQNFPNPFNSQTTIKYNIDFSDKYKLEIYDLVGRKMKQVFEEFKNPGFYKIKIDSDGLSSGIYYYALSSTESRISKQFILIK